MKLPLYWSQIHFLVEINLPVNSKNLKIKEFGQITGPLNWITHNKNAAVTKYDVILQLCVSVNWKFDGIVHNLYIQQINVTVK